MLLSQMLLLGLVKEWIVHKSGENVVLREDSLEVRSIFEFLLVEERGGLVLRSVHELVNYT
jgi:hypothetical protein